MATSFLHGVETIPLTSGPTPIQQVRTGVIGLVGTAPIHRTGAAYQPPALHKPTLVTSDIDAPKFGPAIPGYTIPQALAALGKYAGPVVVINVFDAEVHKATEAEASLDIEADTKTIQLAHPDVLSATVKTVADADCVEGTDYTIDKVQGLITVKTQGALASATKAKVTYTYADPSKVEASDIIGGVSDAGVRTGISAWLNAKNLLGLKPKVLIAPSFSSDRAVASAMLAVAHAKKLRAVVLADVPAGTSLDQVIEGRGPEGEVDLGIHDDRLFYCYPHLSTVRGLEPLATHLAGVIARTDGDLGYWTSPSNKAFSADVKGTELPLTAEYSDEDCDVNRLNAAGVVTAFAAYGSPIRAWGNRASSFPGSQAVTTFVSVQRVRDMLDETIEEASGKSYTDRPINKAFIDAVLEDTNELVRTLIGRGALMPGSATSFIPDKNPPVELAAGRVTFTNRWASPTPAEDIIWESIFDSNLLAQS